jgi:hypothetical protein
MSAQLEGEANYLARARRYVWPSLPMLLVSSSIVCVLGAVALVLAPGITPISLPVWALLVAPAFGALLEQVSAMLDGEDPAAFSFMPALRRSWRLSLGLALPPAFAGSCYLVAYELWLQTGSGMLLAPLAVSGVCAVLLGIAGAIALPLGLGRGDLRGRSLLVTALHLCARHPVAPLGALALGIGFVWSATQFSASLLLLLPGPLAVVLVAAVWTSAQASGILPAEREHG